MGMNSLAPAPQQTPAIDSPFIDRRRGGAAGSTPRERRQFVNSYEELTDDGAELARAVDAYKAESRRRFINYDELLSVVRSLGYDR